MQLQYIPKEYKKEILEMQWVLKLSSRESSILKPLVEWLQDGNRGYVDIPPGLRKEVFYKDLLTEEVYPCSTWESLGYGASEMINSRWLNLVHPDDREQVKIAFHQVIYNDRINIGQGLYRIFDTEGEMHWILSTSAAISRTKNGEVFRYVGRDVEVGNRIEKELYLKHRIHEVEDLWTRERVLIEAAGNIAGSTAPSGLIEALEKGATELFQLSEVQLVVLDENGFKTAMGPDSVKPVTKEDLVNIDRIKGSRIGEDTRAWYLGEIDENSALIALGKGGSPGQDADKLMRTLGPIIMGAWERINHIEVLRRHALTDPLTGAWNRRAFLKQVGRAMRRCIEGGLPAAVAMMDIDLFKNVNDEFGHPFGDRVLMEVSHGINTTLRSGDFMCRWGGEEFAFYMDGADSEVAFDIAERIRIAAGKSCDDMGQCITLSAGVYSIDAKNPETLDSALKKADEALLKAKRTGRNRTFIFKA